MRVISTVLLELNTQGRRELLRSDEETIFDILLIYKIQEKLKPFVKIRRIKHIICYFTWQFTGHKQRNS